MNITLINPRTGNPNTKPPLGLLSIGTICKRAGHNVTIVDMALLNIPVLSNDLIGKADIIGITAMTPYIDQAITIATQLKPLNIPVVIGGVHASVFPQDVYNTGLFKAVIAGEGEELILIFLDDHKKNLVEPIYRSYDDGYASIPIPDYSLIDINAYKPRYPHAKRIPWTSAQTSRGCPFSCKFCANIFGHKYRAMSPIEVVYMLKTLCDEYRIKDITFYDDEFTLDKARILVLCKMLRDMHLDLTWTCEARVDMVDYELLKAMAQAGCRLIYYGIESGNQRILDNLGKGIKLSDAKEAIELTQDLGIEAAAYFMLGCPGETKETILQTLEFADRSDLDHAQFSVCSPLPGSELYELYSNGKEWTKFHYLAGADKVTCPTELTLEYLETAVADGNNMFNKGG